MILHIEQRHIDKARGWASNPRHCPIAHALNEMMGLPGIFQQAYSWHASAAPRHVDICDEMGEVKTRYLPSKEAQTFMANFDNGNEVKPTTIELHQQPVHCPPLFRTDLNGGYMFEVDDD
jgi:hypothetical protein